MDEPAELPEIDLATLRITVFLIEVQIGGRLPEMRVDSRPRRREARGLGVALYLKVLVEEALRETEG